MIIIFIAIDPVELMNTASKLGPQSLRARVALESAREVS